MAFEDLMGTVMGWSTATQALAALGAELALDLSGEKAPPEIDAALRAVSTAGGLSDLDQLAPQQRAIALGIIQLTLRQALDIVAEPARDAGWSFTDPVILDGWGRASGMVPVLIAGSHPDLAQVESFLDVGTGVGLLAVSAANVWPSSTIVGIDPWEASLERARNHVNQAGLGERITLRQQALGDVDDVDTYDCVWVPTFFLTEPALEQALPAVVSAARPGGWIVLGRIRTSPDPLAEATQALETIRFGGANLDTKRAQELLTQAGCVDVHAAPPAGPAPLELVLGQRPPG
jgi:predicted O-methyltransferase YrrM